MRTSVVVAKLKHPLHGIRHGYEQRVLVKLRLCVSDIEKTAKGTGSPVC